jgi:excisionase family DNA binding protein
MTTELLTKKQVAASCGASVRTVERWMACGFLAVVRFNSRHIRFRQEDVAAFIRKHLQLPPEAKT